MFKYGDIKIGDKLKHKILDNKYTVTNVTPESIVLEGTLILTYRELDNYTLIALPRPGWVSMPEGFIYADITLTKRY